MHRFPLYHEFNDSVRSLIDEYAKEIEVGKGTELFAQGDACADILFLVEGHIRVFRLHESGQEITLYFLTGGEQCNVNLNSAFTQTPAIGTAVTESAIVGHLVPAQIVRQIYTEEHIYQQYVFDLFARRLECMAGLIEDVRFKKLDHRLLDWLHDQQKKVIAVTHEKLAAHLGTSREVISRLLKEFEHNGIVVLHRGKIELV